MAEAEWLGNDREERKKKVIRSEPMKPIKRQRTRDRNTGAPGEIARKTGETDIQLKLALDGEGQVDIETDVPFMNHMLDLFAKHGHFDLEVTARGDIDIDDHHTVEDIGICLGQAIREALGDKRGIRRYASVFVPMDEALAQVVIDLSNRPHLEYRAEYPSAGRRQFFSGTGA